MAILHDQTEIVLELIESVVVAAIDFLLHRREIHRMRNEFVIGGHLNRVDEIPNRGEFSLTSASSTGKAK